LIGSQLIGLQPGMASAARVAAAPTRPDFA